MPGTIGGAFVVDYLGPKYTMVSLLPPGREILGLMILIFADHRVIAASGGWISHERPLFPVRVFVFLPIMWTNKWYPASPSILLDSL